MAVLGSTQHLETRRYPRILYVLVPLLALVLQAWLPRVLGQFSWFDFPLVITVYFALGRRSPIEGTLMGASLGIFEDALTHHPIGINGIAKTVVGFLAASLGVRVAVENQAVRLLIIFLLSLLSSAVFVFIYRYLLGFDLQWRWFNELYTAIGNSLIAVVLFPILDRLQLKD
jgi:rod shape-determining protein MreD